MTLLGKICTVLIFIMTIMFGGFAVAVYMTQTNWMAEVKRPRSEMTGNKKLGLEFQLEDAKKTTLDLQAKLDELQNVVARERAARAAHTA